MSSVQMQICSVILKKKKYMYIYIYIFPHIAHKCLKKCVVKKRNIFFFLRKMDSWTTSYRTAKLMHVSSLRGYSDFAFPFFFTRARRQVFWTHIKEGLTFAYAEGRLKQSSLSAGREKKNISKLKDIHRH